MKTAGTYTLKFIGLDADNKPFAMTFSDEFTVSVGAPYRISLSNFVGTAFGGEEFSSNPIVSVLDKGDNVVPTINSGTVVATLSKTPTGTEQLRTNVDGGGFTATFVNGNAQFYGMYINEAGYPYEMTFSTNLVSILRFVWNIFSVY